MEEENEENEETPVTENEENNNEREENEMPEMRKIDRTEWVEFLNTTPSGASATWNIIGVGITDKATDYNAEKTEEKWIINKNKTVTVDSYGLSSGVEQTAYKGDPVFEFVDDIRYRLKTGSEAQTTLLEIDKYSAQTSGNNTTYRARLWTVSIEITSNGGDTAKVNYTINYVGDPTFGTVTFSNGVPTFTEENS